MTRIIIAALAMLVLVGCGTDPMGETSRQRIQADRDVGIAAEAAKADIETERLRQEGAVETEKLRQDGMTDRTIVNARTKPTKWFTIAGVILGLPIILLVVGTRAYREKVIIDDEAAERQHQREMERLEASAVRYLPQPRGTGYHMLDANGRLLGTVDAEDVPEWALIEVHDAVES